MWQKDKKVWNENYYVHTYDIDKNQRSSIQSICRFLLDSAGSHAYKLGFAVPQMFTKNLTWVLSRFSVSMLSYPEWRNIITVQTWPSGLEKLFAMRDFVIFNENKDVIGTAKSAWLVIDVESRKVVRPQVIFKDDRTILDTKASDKKLVKLPGVKLEPEDKILEYVPRPDSTRTNTLQRDSEQRRHFTVRFSDLDMNEHVTSVSYIDWILETVPRQLRSTHIIKEMEINYLSESRYGDTVTAVSEQAHTDSSLGSMLTFNHSLFKLKGLETARARTLWMQT